MRRAVSQQCIYAHVLVVAAMLLSGCVSFGLSPEQEQQLQQVATERPPEGEPVFHVIGLYRGLPPPWNRGDECWRITEPECQRILQHQVEHDVRISISDSRHPIILGLSAYERTHWRLSLAPGVEVRRVILSGRYPQDLSGIDPEVTVEYYVDEDGACPVSRCLETGPGFYDFQAPAAAYKSLVDQPPTSYTGAQEQGWIRIGPDWVGINPP